MTSMNIDCSPLDVLRYTAFDTDGDGGNPAGVVLDARGMDDERMQAIAADLGYSETAFLIDDGDAGYRRFRIRYFSPLAEVAFCGHATIATAVAFAERSGSGGLLLDTMAGQVAVKTWAEKGRLQASLTSVSPKNTLVKSQV
jgi:PhzF family phenazine biosynthesis protein